ncbi:hypothetical protein B0T22DRAFT_143379 [Podospora appendiculata]|uniref:Uncharacterized protein n=1 Tax=Podospora appendiculata TaxID=314037 RepID=A0AAE0X8L4_9PEZI|nr:hypothetical protein B0T22DRAFT_143379 [Podospora appendiculata]
MIRHLERSTSDQDGPKGSGVAVTFGSASPSAGLSPPRAPVGVTSPLWRRRSCGCISLCLLRLSGESQRRARFSNSALDEMRGTTAKMDHGLPGCRCLTLRRCPHRNWALACCRGPSRRWPPRPQPGLDAILHGPKAMDSPDLLWSFSGPGAVSLRSTAAPWCPWCGESGGPGWARLGPWMRFSSMARHSYSPVRVHQWRLVLPSVEDPWQWQCEWQWPRSGRQGDREALQPGRASSRRVDGHIYATMRPAFQHFS